MPATMGMSASLSNRRSHSLSDQPVSENTSTLMTIVKNMNVVPQRSWIVDIVRAFSTVNSSPCS